MRHLLVGLALAFAVDWTVIGLIVLSVVIRDRIERRTRRRP